MEKNRNNQDWIWDRYWQFDRVASCFDTKGSNYPVDFKTDWDDFLTRLPEGAKILDLCTGNGAIARLALAFSTQHGKNFAITGADRAAIDPERFVSESAGAIKFVGGAAAEALPFDDNLFDAVTSQYGFEYTGADKTLAEIARVLKPGGQVRLVCHAREGAPVASSRIEAANIEYVTTGLDLFAKARAAIRAAADKNASAKAADAKIEAFKAALSALEEKLHGDPDNPYFEAALGLLRHTFEVRGHFPLAVLIEKIDATELETLAHQGRTKALIKAALSKADCAALGRALKAAGFENFAVAPFYLDAGSKLVGWRLDFSKKAK